MDNDFASTSSLSLAEQVAGFLETLEVTVPENVPNWNEIPDNDSKNPPSETNKTTDPMFTQ